MRNIFLTATVLAMAASGWAATLISLPGGTGQTLAGDCCDIGIKPNSEAGPMPSDLLSTYFNGLDTAVAEVNSIGLVANVSVSAAAIGTGVASAGATYYFGLIGPFDTTVPVMISGLIALRLGPDIVGDADAHAFLYISDDEDDTLVLGLSGCVPVGCSPDSNTTLVGDGDFVRMLMLSSNTRFRIDLGAGVNPNDSSGMASADAIVDPFIQIDPTFLADNPGFSVEVSPGINNSAAVPEPSTVGLSLIGLVGFAYSCYRRSGKVRES